MDCIEATRALFDTAGVSRAPRYGDNLLEFIASVNIATKHGAQLAPAVADEVEDLARRMLRPDSRSTEELLTKIRALRKRHAATS